MLKELGQKLRAATAKVGLWWDRARFQRRRTRHALERLAELQAQLEKLPAGDSAKRNEILGAMERTNARIANRRRKLANARERAKFWAKRQTTLRAKYREAKAAWEAEHRLDFQTWMLNGHSADIDDDLKPIIAFLVVACGLVVTDTYDYRSHTPSSYHYPWNDPTPPQQGRAADIAGANMADAMNKAITHFGVPAFAEFFGPQSRYVKNGAEYQYGASCFPGHCDHLHAAVL